MRATSSLTLFATLALAACADDADNRANHPPSIAGVTISPAQPLPADALVADVIDATDPDGDSTLLAYEWRIDGVLAPDHTSNTIPTSVIRNGETWSVTVTPSDGRVSGEPQTAAVTVANIAPVLASVTIVPETPTRLSTLSAVVAGADADADPLAYTYAWTVNGAFVATTETLSAATLTPGDVVALTVSASDGWTSTERAASPVAIGNLAPVLVSVAISPATPRKGDVLSVALETASDAEGDPLTFRYAWSVNGTVVTTTDTLDSTFFSRMDTVSVEVTPSDGFADGPSATSAVVDVVNSEPVVTVTMPRNHAPDYDIICNIAVSDADGDIVDVVVTWWQDGLPYPRTPGTTTFDGDTLPLFPGHKDHVFRCDVVCDDGHGGTASGSASTTAYDTLVLVNNRELTGGTYLFDRLVVPAGVTLTISGHIDITAVDSQIDGFILGVGGGHPAPAPPNAVGTGPGGGGIASPIFAGAGGGGYGGAGGKGGSDPGDNPGAGGASYGDATSQTVDMGSSGGSSQDTRGGAGGAAFILRVGQLEMSGTIDVSGGNAELPGYALGGGGGAGGGILIMAQDAVMGGTLRADGGQGSDGTMPINDGGGGGGGGRIKIFYTSSLSNTALTSVAGGAAGIYGAIRGDSGATGTVHVEQLQ